jgi:hypothetical protein
LPSYHYILRWKFLLYSQELDAIVATARKFDVEVPEVLVAAPSATSGSSGVTVAALAHAPEKRGAVNPFVCISESSGGLFRLLPGL